jgi:hypothetical protein
MEIEHPIDDRHKLGIAQSRSPQVAEPAVAVKPADSEAPFAAGRYLRADQRGESIFSRFSWRYAAGA